MLNIKKSLALLLAASSSLVFASSAQGSVVTPGENNAWEVGVAALYLQPSFAGNGLGYSSFSNYAGADNQQVKITHNGANHINNITPRWDYGFKLEGAYYFCADNDLNLNWSHLDEDVDGHLPAGSLFSGSVDGYYADRLQVSSKWDAVNIEVGKHISFCDKKWLRLHAGLEFVRIKNTFTNYPKLFSNADPYFVSIDTLSYRGLGPRLGADFGSALGCGFGVYAKTAGSFLVGTAKQTITGYRDVTNAFYGLIPFGTSNFVLSSHNAVVPQVEAKLGVTYDREFACGTLGLNLGYLWMNYVSAIASYTGMGIVGPSLGIPATTNFNLNGLYLGFNWTGDI